MLKENLEENIKNFMNSAEMIYRTEDYTSAAIIYFKALFSVYDLIILKEKGFVPKDHGERFKVLKENFYEFYLWLDENFEIYRNSYSNKIEKEDCDKIREYVEEIIKEQGI